MTDIRERLARAIGSVTNVNFEDPESPSCKIAFFEADAALAKQPEEVG